MFISSLPFDGWVFAPGFCCPLCVLGECGSCGLPSSECFWDPVRCGFRECTGGPGQKAVLHLDLLNPLGRARRGHSSESAVELRMRLRDWIWWRRERDLKLSYLPQWPTSFSGRLAGRFPGSACCRGGLGRGDGWWEEPRWGSVAVPAEVFEKGFL